MSGFPIHRTIRHPTHIIDILKGTFRTARTNKPNSQQYLVCFTARFEIFNLDMDQNNNNSIKYKFRKMYMQNLFSKVYSVCLGPRGEEFDSFFIAREKDVILFEFSKEEDLFIAKQIVNLNPICISPSNIFNNGNTLVVSTCRGVISTYDITQHNYIETNTIKTTSVTPQSYLIDENTLCRIEYGTDDPRSIFVKYQINPFKRLSQRVIPQKFFYSFPFLDGIVFVFQDRLKFMNDSNEMDLRYPQDETLQTYEPVFASINMGHAGILMITKKTFRLMLLSYDCSVRILPHVIRPHVINLFALSNELFLIANKITQHTGYKIDSKDPIFYFQSVIGTKFLHVGNPRVIDKTTLVPQAVSLTGHAISLTKHGPQYQVAFSQELEATPLGIYYTEYQNHKLALISFATETKIIDISHPNDCRQVDPSMEKLIHTDNQTVGVCTLFPNNPEKRTLVFHFLKNYFYTIGQDNKRMSLPASEVIVACSYTSKQFIFATNMKNVTMYAVNNVDQLDHDNFQTAIDVAAFSYSPPEGNGYAPYIAIGYSKKKFVIMTSATDRTQRIDLTEKDTPEEIISMAWIKKDHLYLLLGLENGFLISCVFNEQERIITKTQCFSLGPGQIHLTNLTPLRNPQYSAQCVFAYNTRSWIIAESKGILQLNPLASPSLNCCLYYSTNWIIAAAGRNLQIGSIDQSHENYVMRSSFKDEKECIGFFVIEGSSFAIVAQKSSVICYDMYSTITSQEIIKFEQKETVTAMGCYRFNPEDPKIYLALVTSVRMFDQSKPELKRTYSYIRVFKMVWENHKHELKVERIVIEKIGMILYSVAIVARENPFIANVFAGAIKTIYFFRVTDFPAGLGMQMFTYLNVGLYTRHIVAAYFDKSNIVVYAGDGGTSVKLLFFDEKTKEFQVVAEEGNLRTITALNLQDRHISGGDISGNVFIIDSGNPNTMREFQVDHEFIKSNKRLPFRLNYYVGDAVTGTHTTLSRLNEFFFLWYCTIGGGLGHILHIKPEVYNENQTWKKSWSGKVSMLKQLEMIISTWYFSHTHCDPITYRNKDFPATNILDMDVIELYFGMSPARKDDVARQICEIFKKYPLYADLSPNDIDCEISTVRSYFSDWYSIRS